MQISVVSPVYMAEDIVDELVKRIIKSISKLTDDFEIILVEDNSPDESWKKIEENCKKDKRVKGIKLVRNFGQHYAITAGLEVSAGDCVAVMDCDLQHDPEYICKMYEKLMEGYDIVYTRFENKTHSFVRNLLSKFFCSIFNWLSDNNFSDEKVGCFSMITRKVVISFCKINDVHRHYLMILRWLGFKHTYIKIIHSERYSGKSSYSFLRLCSLAMDGIVSQSDKLLRLSTATGFAFAILSILMAIGLVLSYFVTGFKEGWASLITVILMSTGLILISIGILGIYTGKTFEQVKNRPIYLVEKKINFNN